MNPSLLDRLGPKVHKPTLAADERVVLVVDRSWKHHYWKALALASLPLLIGLTLLPATGEGAASGRIIGFFFLGLAGFLLLRAYLRVQGMRTYVLTSKRLVIRAVLRSGRGGRRRAAAEDSIDLKDVGNVRRVTRRRLDDVTVQFTRGRFRDIRIKGARNGEAFASKLMELSRQAATQNVVVRHESAAAGPAATPLAPLDLLKHKLVAGEISEEDYERKRALLLRTE